MFIFEFRKIILIFSHFKEIKLRLEKNPPKHTQTLFKLDR